MREIRTAGLALALALGTLGCTGYIRGTATVTTPTLVLIDTDVWVIENYDEPVFYTDGYYWRYRTGIWYRSHVHYEGWVSVSVVPARVRRIDQPTRYVRYVAPPDAPKRVGPPDHAPAHGVRGTQPGHHKEPPRGLSPARDADRQSGPGPGVMPDRGEKRGKGAAAREPDQGPREGAVDKPPKGKDKDKDKDKHHDKGGPKKK